MEKRLEEIEKNVTSISEIQTSLDQDVNSQKNQVNIGAVKVQMIKKHSAEVEEDVEL